ncbi:DNA-J related domain-containing protein [Pseudaeromonas sp. ZJS20]|uniref:DNA-J related domain-containing protein n=1 Tax=Pseudaeromonas aegiceratis TaxID=3153928 RepID=UPI00390CAA42
MCPPVPSFADDNPLLLPLLARLQAAAGPCKLHELMTQLQAEGLLPQGLAGDALGLFRTNFLLMNGLYQLQGLLSRQGAWLAVSPLDLRIEPGGAVHGGLLAPDSLRDYYLDWQNLWQTEAVEVEALLAGFWQAFCRRVAPAARLAALAVLELPETASQADIRRRWKALALAHHPDRGGELARFQAIELAWRTLRD